MPKPVFSPRGENTINPALGALLGAAIGSIIPSQSASQSGAGGISGGGGSGGSGFLSTVYDFAKDYFKPSSGSFSDLVSTNTQSSQAASQSPSSSTSYPSVWTIYKEGGLATPLMADGGQASYYTYGTPVDPKDIMNQMAHGGAAKHGGLHVPTVEGRHDYRAGARVTGEGDGQSDDIPAMLADGEYVIDSETVAQLGNGSTKAGSDLLDKFREEIRAHKRSAPVDKIPPPSKSPLAYMKAAQKKVRSA
jgi:hypothetical protein